MGFILKWMKWHTVLPWAELCNKTQRKGSQNMWKQILLMAHINILSVSMIQTLRFLKYYIELWSKLLFYFIFEVTSNFHISYKNNP